MTENEAEYKKIIQSCTILRDVQKSFEEWSNLSDSRRVLFVKGTKGIGKTTEILKFAYKNFEQVIYVNLEEKNDLNKFIETVVRDSNKYLGMYDFCIEHKGYWETVIYIIMVTLWSCYMIGEYISEIAEY